MKNGIGMDESPKGAIHSVNNGLKSWYYSPSLEKGLGELSKKGSHFPYIYFSQNKKKHIWRDP